MKSNLRRKLFLSLAATAACAATLTSTTFAWYTQNDTVTTDKVNAVTESSIDTGSIYISAGSNYAAGNAEVRYADEDIVTIGEGENAKTYVKSTVTDNGNGSYSLKAEGAGNNVEAAVGDVKTPAVAKNTAQTWAQYKSSATPVLVNNKHLTLTDPVSPATMATDAAQQATILTPVYYDGINYLPIRGVTDKYTQCGATETYAASTVYYSKNAQGNYTVVDASGFTAGTTSVKDYYKKTAMGDVTYNSESSANQMEFVYRLRTANAGVATTVYFKDFSITNTTAGTFPSQVALVSGNGTGISAPGSYSVDLLSALKMTISITSVTKEQGEANAAATADAVSTVYNFKAFATKNDNVDVAAVGAQDGTKGNAIGYYNTALGTNISAPEDYNEGTKLLTSGSTQLSFQIPTTGYVEVRFVFWLDGWDSYCYDTCRQQSFQFGTNFTTTACSNNSYTTVYTA